VGLHDHVHAQVVLGVREELLRAIGPMRELREAALNLTRRLLPGQRESLALGVEARRLHAELFVELARVAVAVVLDRTAYHPDEATERAEAAVAREHGVGQ